jgi:hypothetical protein
MEFDVFNGDADGISSLIQLRLAEPRQSRLITGVKRDIELLQQVQAKSGDRVTVLDISMAKNQQPLHRILQAGCAVFYADHHQPGEIPKHPRLQAIIDTSASTCTSLLVHHYIQRRYPGWAMVGAFGDNLDSSALQVAKDLDLSAEQTNGLKQLGICINYNGYGASIEDLHFSPDELYKEMAVFACPFDFIRENPLIHQQLLDGYAADMAAAGKMNADYETDTTAVYVLPDEAWARRVSGVFGNDLANQAPDKAHAVLTWNAQGGFVVSVRAPLTNKTGADELCGAFPSGGGRKAAAGINHLPEAELGEFITALQRRYTVTTESTNE